MWALTYLIETWLDLLPSWDYLISVHLYGKYLRVSFKWITGYKRSTPLLLSNLVRDQLGKIYTVCCNTYVISFIFARMCNNGFYLFLWWWAGGFLRILQSNWFRERAVFSYLLTTVMVTNYAKRRLKLRIERAKSQFVLIFFFAIEQCYCSTFS